MPEPLKNHFGKTIPVTIAEMITSVYPQFPGEQFIKETLKGYKPLNLMSRGRKIAVTLRRYLPGDYDHAIHILLQSCGKKPGSFPENNGMASFLYLPYTMYVAEYGLDYFETSMRAQYELTKLFTAEFSIRPFLEKHTKATLDILGEWTMDPDPHVRRLVSEGTRPRLPWASRLRKFQTDPRPVLALLEMLKDDPEIYVRRSVANNLNDIGKDHPAMLIETARRWMNGATPGRQWLIRHALRSAIKKGDPGALKLLGFGKNANVSIENIRITPKRPTMGGSVNISFEIINPLSKRQQIIIDFRIHYIKATGRSNPKVFKLKSVDLGPNDRMHFGKSISLKEMTTRKHYPGKHKIDLMLNGKSTPAGYFILLENKKK